MQNPIPVNSKLRQWDRWAGFLLGVLLASVLGQMIYQRPFFGLMDDATHLGGTYWNLQSQGVLNHSFEFLKQDLGWGMSRALYPLMIWIWYGIAIHWGPLAFYLFNALVVMTVLGAAARVLSTMLGLSFPFLLLTLFAWPYHFDLLQHPSLQEKLVIASGTGFLWCVWRLSKSQDISVLWRSVFGALLFLGLGFASKLSFVVWATPGLFWLGVGAHKNPKLRAPLAVLFLFFLGFLGLGVWIASNGFYTRTYHKMSLVLPHLLSRNGLFFLGAIGASVGLSLKKRDLSWALPGVGLTSFLVVFLPWMLSGYLLSLVGIFVGAIALQVAGPRGWARIAIVLLAFTVGIFRPYVNFVRLGDLGRVVGLAKEWESGELRLKELYLPCAEGSLAFGLFLDRYGKSKMVSRLVDENTDLPGKAILFDRGMCELGPMLENKLNQKCQTERLYSSAYSGGYQVIRVKGCEGESVR